MSTYREIIYIVLDEIKARSDDSIFNENHVRFLVDKYRMMILKKIQEKTKGVLSQSNYQTICVPMVSRSGDICDEFNYLKSSIEVPTISDLSEPSIRIKDSSIEISNISKERLNYAGSSKYSGNTIYGTLEGSTYTLKSRKSLKYVKTVQISAIFEDASKAAELSCNSSSSENADGGCYLDATFPMEDAYVPMIIDYVVKELTQAYYRPEGTANNSTDETPNKMLAAQAAAARRARVAPTQADAYGTQV